MMGNKKISIGIIAVLGIEAFIHRYYFWVFCIGIIILLVINLKGRIVYIRMPGQTSYCVFLIMGICIGLYNVATGAQPTWPYLRDIITVTRLALFWNVGILFGLKYQYNRAFLYRTIFVYVFLYTSLQTVLRLYGYISSDEQGFSAFVSSGAVDQFTVAFGLFIAFFKPSCISRYFISKSFDTVAKIIIMISAVLAFSRTLILDLLCLTIAMWFGQLRKIAKFGLVALAVLIIVSMITPAIFNFFIDKWEHSIMEISRNNHNSSWTEYDVVWNWRGYEMYCAVEQYKDYDVVAKLFGKGFGQSTDALGYAYLVTGEDGLAFLHNGYYTALIKCGLIGLILYVFYFLETILYYLQRRMPKYEKKIIMGMILSMAVSAYIIGGVFWGGESLLMYMILGWFSVSIGSSEEDQLYSLLLDYYI